MSDAQTEILSDRDEQGSFLEDFEDASYVKDIPFNVVVEEEVFDILGRPETEEEGQMEFDSSGEDARNIGRFENIFRNTSEPDVIAGRYKICIDQPLPQYSAPHTKAFAIEDLRNRIDNLYVLLFEPQHPTRLESISILKNQLLNDFQLPVEVQILYVTGHSQYQLAVVLAFPNGISFREYVRLKGACSENFITSHVLLSVIQILSQLHRLGIVHGSINPDRVYIDPNNNNKIMVGECISGLCGETQPGVFEPIERATCHPISRGAGDVSADLYALGMLCFYLFVGYDSFSDHEPDDILQQRLAKGSYNVIAGLALFPNSLRDLLKGLVCDKRADRWKERQIFDWLQGTVSNQNSLLQYHSQATRQIMFNDQYFYSCHSLAYELSCYWEAAKKFLKDPMFIKWVDRSVGDIRMASRLLSNTKMVQQKSGLVALDENDFVSRSLVMLDPDGPLRMREVATTISGVGTTLAHSYVKGKKDYMRAVAKIIANNLVGIYLDIRPDLKKSILLHNDLQLLESASPMLARKDYGFGLERVLYHLNPSLPCQSPIVANECIYTIGELMQTLDEKVRQSRKPIKIMDRHIAAFIASRFGISNEVRISGLSEFKAFERNDTMRALVFLSIAQKRCKIKSLKGLSLLIADSLKPVIELFHNRRFQKDLEGRVSKIAKKGDLSELLKTMSNNAQIQSDFQGFKKACENYRYLEARIQQLSDLKKIYEIGYSYGLRFSVVISYLICSAVIIMLITRSLGSL